MTTDLREKIAEVLAGHRQWATDESIVCVDCGQTWSFDPIGSYAESMAAYERHVAEAILAAIGAVGVCGAILPQLLGGDVPQSVCDLLAGHMGWHGADNPTPALMPRSRMSWTEGVAGFHDLGEDPRRALTEGQPDG